MQIFLTIMMNSFFTVSLDNYYYRFASELVKAKHWCNMDLWKCPGSEVKSWSCLWWRHSLRRPRLNPSHSFHLSGEQPTTDRNLEGRVSHIPLFMFHLIHPRLTVNQLSVCFDRSISLQFHDFSRSLIQQWWFSVNKKRCFIIRDSSISSINCSSSVFISCLKADGQPAFYFTFYSNHRTLRRTRQSYTILPRSLGHRTPGSSNKAALVLWAAVSPHCPPCGQTSKSIKTTKRWSLLLVVMIYSRLWDVFPHWYIVLLFLSVSCFSSLWT